MPTQSRSTLSRQDIDQKAEEVVLHFDPHALERPSCPLWDVVNGLKERYHIPFHFYQELGYSSRGKKILGRFDFHPRQVLIDRILPHDSPRFRWTLGHEIGHLVLHRRLDPSRISQDTPSFVDTRTELRFLRSAQWSDLRWIEWQATYFGSALLLPRPVVLAAVIRLQVE